MDNFLTKQGYLSEKALADGTKSFVLSDESIDADMERMKIGGIDLSRFKNNSTMLFMHRNGDFPIGTWNRIKKGGGQLVATPVFFEEDDEALRIQKYVEAGILKAASIGFMSIETVSEEPPEEYKEMLKKYYWRDTITVHKKSILLEASIVPIGSNANALREKAITKSIGNRSYELKEQGVINEKDHEWLVKIITDKQDSLFPNISLTAKDYKVPDDETTEEKDIEINNLHKQIEELKMKLDGKAGATISKANLKKLKTATDKLAEATDSINDVIATAEKDEDDKFSEGRNSEPIEINLNADDLIEKIREVVEEVVGALELKEPEPEPKGNDDSPVVISSKEELKSCLN